MEDGDGTEEGAAKRKPRGSRRAAKLAGDGDDEAPVDEMTKLKLELESLREKVSGGGKLSGKEKRQLKKLEDAEERWKEYEGVALSTDDGGGDGGGGIGAQFSSDSRGAGTGEAGCLGDGIEVASFSIRANATELFVNARLSLKTGRCYGLIGANGSGKTTLLRHLSSRALAGVPKSLHILHVEQEVRSSEATVLESVLSADTRRAALLQEEEALEAQLGIGEDGEAGDEDAGDAEATAAAVMRLVAVYDELELLGREAAEARARTILSGLGFSASAQDAPTLRLSGGWRMRVALARALYMQPELLLLDEPTNHLDLDAVIWLQQHLAASKQTAIIVSHDQHFLNAVVAEIMLLEGKQLHYFEGDYDSFKRRHSSFVADLRKKSAFEAKELQKLNNNLHSGKGGADTKAGRKAMKDRLEELKDAPKALKEYRVQFEFPAPSRRLNPPLITMEKVSFGYGGPLAPGSKSARIFTDLNFELSMDSRVALVGPNGCGKSTFLHLLDGTLTADDGTVDQANGRLRMGRYNQHLVDELPLGVSPVDHVHQLLGEPVQRGSPTYQQVRTELGTKGLPSLAHELKIRDLSGGQKARVTFAAIAAMRPHVLLMDEPTNHLDIESVDALVEGINSFEGGVVLISHDRRLLQRTDCSLWLTGKGAIEKLPGEGAEAYDAYEKRVLKQIAERQRAEEERAAVRAAERRKRREQAKKQAAQRARGVGSK